MPRKRGKVPPSAKPKGRIGGVAVGSSPKNTRANRSRNWKSGKYARTVSPREAVEQKLTEKYGEDVPALIEQSLAVIQTGDVHARDLSAAKAMVNAELVLRGCFDRINEEGVLVDDQILGPNGEMIGIKRKANPALPHMIALQEVVGYTADQLQLSPKARDEAKKNQAVQAYLEREKELLRGADSRRRALPGPSRVIDTTVVRE